MSDPTTMTTLIWMRLSWPTPFLSINPKEMNICSRKLGGKFDPDVFLMREPVEVESIDLATLSGVYWNNYDG